MPTQFTISRIRDSLILEYITVNADGKENKGRIANPFNGSETMGYNLNNLKVKRKLRYVKGTNEFTVNSVYYMPENNTEVDFTRIETFKVIDGNSHLNKKSIETRGETWEVNGVYSKK